MQRSEKRKRTELVGVRLTPEEHAQLLQKANAIGVSCADFLRSAGLGKKMSSPKIERDAAIALARELRAIGTNLNQLAKVANATRNIEAGKELDELRGGLNQIWRLLS